ncbi:MAG: hypothetical protein IKJ43_03515 [Bacilli bacterium]|nr:hypothetical protein [Bacilli bacterium]
MIKISVSSFLSTLKEIIFSSKESIIFIILGLLFLTTIIINIKRKKTIGRKLFLISWGFIILFILFKYNTYLSILFDNFINNVFMQIFFPNLATYVIIIILSNILYLELITQKKKKNYEKIINTIFYTIIMFIMVYTLDEIIINNINIYSEEVYKNQKILILIESTTITFTIWTTLLIGKRIITKLINLSTAKVKKDFKKKAQNPIFIEDNSNNKEIKSENIQIEKTISNEKNNKKENIIINPVNEEIKPLENNEINLTNEEVKTKKNVHIVTTKLYHFKKS